LKEGKVEAACQEAERALRLAEEVGDLAELGWCNLLYGETLFRKGDSSRALPHLEGAESFFERAGMQQSLLQARDLLERIRKEVAYL